MFQSPSGQAGLSVSRGITRRRPPQARPSRWHAAAVVIATCALMNPLAALAAYTCTGKVKQLTTDPGGGVNLSLVGDGVSLSWQGICSVSDASEGIPPAACRAILVTLKEAQVTQRPVTFWFDYSYSGPAKCSDADHPPWTSLRSSGWYWGPTIIVD